MAERPLRVLQVGTVDHGGGAASVAASLMRGYRARGCEAWLAVGLKTGSDPDVFTIPDDDRAVYRAAGYQAAQTRLRRMAGRFPGAGWGSVSRSMRLVTHPRALAEQWRGVEDFNFPGTRRLLDLAPCRPDVVHCHNLHGGYFDLRALAWLSAQVPTVLTLHDSWLLSGHCAHSFDCERWKTGCGECPDLSIAPAIRRDATAANWLRKKTIYARSRLHVASPSRWLLQRAGQSMFAPAIAEGRVIPNGVDMSVFRPAEKGPVRAALDIPADALVLLSIGGGRNATWKDHGMQETAIAEVVRRMGPRVHVVALGGDTTANGATRANVRVVGRQTSPEAMARYYQASDVYVHGARADTFPLAILEALACGTPVVATAVGGIPEQIQSADAGGVRRGALEPVARATGVLVPSGAAKEMAEAVVALLECTAARQLIANNAARAARAAFDQDRQIECYLGWYRTIIDDWNRDGMSNADGTSRAARPDGLAVD